MATMFQQTKKKKANPPNVPDSFLRRGPGPIHETEERKPGFDPKKRLSLSRKAAPSAPSAPSAASPPPPPSPSPASPMAPMAPPDPALNAPVHTQGQEATQAGPASKPSFSGERAGFRREGENCGGCLHYQADSASCAIVDERQISPEDTCGLYTSPDSDSEQGDEDEEGDNQSSLFSNSGDGEEGSWE